jgi:hypothetical protein
VGDFAMRFTLIDKNLPRSRLPVLDRCSRRGGRRLVKRMRFTPSKVHDGKILVSVDLSEINYKPLSTSHF